MSYLTVVPAYGRDYKSAKAVKADWAAGKDFLVADVFNRWNGKPINKADADAAGYTVMVSYAAKRKVVQV